MRLDLLYKMVIIGGICGYELVAAITSLIGIESRPYSVAVRALVALLALGLICKSFGEVLIDRKFTVLALAAIWLAYAFRIYYASYLSDEVLIFAPSYYWMWAIGACALPAIAASLWKPRFDDGIRMFILLFAALIVSGVVAAFGGSSIEVRENNLAVETGRLQLTSLNPILLGQLGATIVVLSAWALLPPKKGFNFLTTMLLVGSGLLGAALLIGANSRGPIVSTVLSFVFMVTCSKGKGRYLGMGVFILAAASFVPATYYLEQQYGFSTYTRLFEQSQISEGNTQDRLGRYAAALHGVALSPLTGSGLEEPENGGYPHNIIIEAFMSMGVIVGSVFVMLLVVLLIRAGSNYRRMPMYGWSSLLFVQYSVASQFSGAIYTTNYFWVSVGIVLAVWASALRRGIIIN